MPLFFIISGYTEALTEKARKSKFSEYVCNKFKRIMVPYFCFEIINYIVWVVVCIIKEKETPTISAAISIISCVNLDTYMGLYGRLWFLPCMFVSCCAFWIIQRLLKSKLAMIPVAVISFGISWLLAYLEIGRLPFTLDIMFMALPFCLLGYSAETIIKKLFTHRRIVFDMLIIGFSLVGLLASYQRGAKMLMYINQYGNYLFTISAALFGSLLFSVLVKYAFILSKRISLVNKLVLWYGYNSLISFPVHLQIKCISLLLSIQFINMGNWWLMFVIMLLLNVPIVNFFLIYLPFVTGNFPKR